MQLDKLSIQVEANSVKAEKAFARLGRSLEDFDRALDEASKGTGRFQTKADEAAKGTKNLAHSFGASTKQLFFFKEALSLVGRGLSEVYKLAEEGARNATAEKFFLNAGKSLEDYRQATKGLISDADLIKKANLADTMGINGEAFKSLATVAQAASAKTGQSYKHMLDSIVVGTARESRLLLDNLGIIVNVTKAREDYIQKLRESGQLGERASESNKKLATQLTDEAEKVAFLTAAMASGKPMLEEYANSGDKASESFDKFNAAIANLKDSIGRGLSTVLSGVLPQLTEFINELTRAVSLLDSDSWNVVKELMLAVGAVGLAVGGIPGAVLGAAAGGIGAGIGVAQDTGRGQIIQQQEDLLAVLQGTTDSSITLRDVLAMHEQDIEAFTMRWGDLDVQQEQAIKDLIDTIRALSEKLGTEVNKLPPLKPVTGSGVTFKPKEGKQSKWESGAWLEDAADSHRKGIDSLVDDLNKHDKAIKKASWDTIKDYQKGMKDIFREQKKAAAEEQRQREEYFKAMEEAAEALKAMREKFDADAASVIGVGSAAVSGDVSAFTASAGALIGGALGMPQVGAALGQALGPFLADLVVVVNLFNSLADGAKRLFVNAFGEVAETLKPLGDAMLGWLVSVGNLIGAILRPFVPIIDLVIGAMAFLIDVTTSAIVALTPFVEIIVLLWDVFGTLFVLLLKFAGFLGEALFGVEDFNLLAGLEALGNSILDLAIWFNNWMVENIRKIPGFEDFGKTVSRADFEAAAPPIEPIDDNTDATKENTKAVRELAREFRNLPQGYRVNRALFNAETPRGGIQPIPGFRPIPVSPNRNFRFRP